MQIREESGKAVERFGIDEFQEKSFAFGEVAKSVSFFAFNLPSSQLSKSISEI